MTGSPVQGVLSEVPGWPLRDPLRDPQNLSEPLRPVVPIPVAPQTFSDCLRMGAVECEPAGLETEEQVLRKEKKHEEKY